MMRATAACALVPAVLVAAGCGGHAALPLHVRPGEALVAGVVSDHTRSSRALEALLFTSPSLVPIRWTRIEERTLVAGGVRPGRVVLSLAVAPPDGNRNGRSKAVGGLAADVPGPGCFWFGGIEVQRGPVGEALFVAFDAPAAPALAALRPRLPALAACLDRPTPLALDLEAPLKARP